MNSNGVLSFDDPFTEYRPRVFPFISPPLIAPFWRDLNPSRGGSISYRQTNDSLELQRVHGLLSSLDVGDLVGFFPIQLFVVTWNQVPPFQTGGSVGVCSYTCHNTA